jgi:hydrogenase maturation protease
MKSILVMGIGNLLLGDEGIGVHAVRILQDTKLPDHVEILDVGTAFLDATPALEKNEKIIVIDAMMADGEPGSIYRVPLGQCYKNKRIDSMHGFDIFNLFAMTNNRPERDVVVLGVEPFNISWSMELSPVVSSSIPLLLDAVHDEIKTTTLIRFQNS